MRPSDYNIILNVDKEKQVNVLLNCYTGAFDLVNDDVAGFLKGKNASENISEESINKLIERGYLTSLSSDDETLLIKKIAESIHDSVRFQSYNFHFIISYDCNLRCVYCFENGISTHGTNWPKEKITKNQVDKAFQVIKEKVDLKKSSNTIVLYGGEPFLADNYDIVEYIINKGEEIGFQFNVITNGYDADKYIPLISKYKNFTLQITIDGTKEIHNVNRPHYKNKDSFEKITNNVDLLLRNGARVAIRINADENTLIKIDELTRFFEEKGWMKNRNFSTYLALLVADMDNCSILKNRNTSAPTRINQSEKSLNHIKLLSKYYDLIKNGTLQETVLCQDFNIFSIIKNILIGDGRIVKRSVFCGAQSNNIIFDPLGDVYSCWEVVGISEHKIGHYVPDFLIYQEGIDKFFSRNIGNTSCLKCQYNLICGGGCMGPGALANDFTTKNCNDFQQLFNFIVKYVYNSYLAENL